MRRRRRRRANVIYRPQLGARIPRQDSDNFSTYRTRIIYNMPTVHRSRIPHMCKLYENISARLTVPCHTSHLKNTLQYLCAP